MGLVLRLLARVAGLVALLALGVGLWLCVLRLPAPGPLRILYVGIGLVGSYLLTDLGARLLRRTAGERGGTHRDPWYVRVGAIAQAALVVAVMGWGMSGLTLLNASARFETYRHGLEMHQKMGFVLMPPLLLLVALSRGRALFGLRAAMALVMYPLLVLVVQPAPFPLLGNTAICVIVLPLLIWRFIRRRISPGVAPAEAWTWYLHYVVVAVTVAAGVLAFASPPDVRFIMALRKIHRALGLTAFAVTVAYVLRVSGARLGRPSRLAPGIQMAVAVVLGLALMGASLSRFGAARERYLESAARPSPVLAAERGEAHRPLPLAALAASDECGECHALTFGQWEASTHARSGANLAFRASVRQIAAADGDEAVRLCLTCHLPALAYAEDLAPLWDDGYLTSSDGVGCRACHYVTEATQGNGRYALSLPRADALVEDAERPRFVQSSVLEHIGDVSRPVVSDGRACYPCHSFRIERDGRELVPYDVVSSFLDSGLTDHLRCQDCHMPRLAIDRNQYSWKDHGFFGSQLWLEEVLPAGIDEHARLRAAELEDNTRRWAAGELPDVSWRAFHDEIGLRPHAPLRAVRSQAAILRMLNDPVRFEMELDPRLEAAGDGSRRLAVELELRSRMVGHDFPANLFANVSSTWVRLEVRDATGRLLASDDDLRLGQTEIGPHGEPTAPTERENYVDVLHHGYIDPVDGLSHRYELEVDADARFPLLVEASLRQRRYDPAYLSWIGVEEPEAVGLRVLAEGTRSVSPAGESRSHAP